MKGDDQAITLRNSNHPQFDRAFAESLKEDHPSIWDAGGNIRGNDAFVLWGRAREVPKRLPSWIGSKNVKHGPHATLKMVRSSQGTSQPTQTLLELSPPSNGASSCALVNRL